MSRILVTRPVEDAEPFAGRLRASGHEVMIEPLLEIVPVDGPPPDVGGIQALLFTSANGVRAFERRSVVRHLPVFAVGNATATAARDAGFGSVASAAGDVEALAALVAASLTPSGGALLHVAASVRAGDLSGALHGRGFTVERSVLYEARPATALTTSTISALSEGRVDAVALFSPRTARSLAVLLERAGILAPCAGIDAACLSQAVASEAATIPWRAVLVAARPDQDAMVAVLKS